MAMTSDETTKICSHCDRAIPSSNIDLHFAHCSRNLERCKVCGDMVPRKYAEEHFLNTHAPVACSQCSETMEREILAIHKGEKCPQRIVTCDFCEFPLPAVDLAEHQVAIVNNFENGKTIADAISSYLGVMLCCFVIVGSLWESHRTLSSV